MSRMNRRNFLAATAATAAGFSLRGTGSEAAPDPKKRRYLIVLGCTGGASILDSFLALSEAEVAAAGGTPDTLNCFSPQQLRAIDGTPLRAVDLTHTFDLLGGFKIETRQSEFVRKHMAHTLVMTQEVSSVNHAVAETRSVTGAGAWRGRTLQECVAATFGEGLPVPNLDMGTGGFRHASGDSELPRYAAPSLVADPLYWAFGLSATRGAKHGVRGEVLAAARSLRDGGLEGPSAFLKAYASHPAVKRWLGDRSDGRKLFEDQNLIDRALFLRRRPADMPADPEMARLFDVFPDFETDELEAQAILAYLAITRGLSCSVTLAPSFAAAAEDLANIRNPPLAFDFSHQDHRGSQAMMWQRMLSIADRLVTLLQEREHEGGGSYWDRSLVYFATDFGRDKTRPSGAHAFSSGHHLNNASVVMSPLVRGNTVLGGIDAKTGLTHGFDLATGEARKDVKAGEREVFAGILQTLGVDTSTTDLPDVRAMRKNA